MSSSSMKRKAKIIRVKDDESFEEASALDQDAGEPSLDFSRRAAIKKTVRKPLRQSGLRKTFSAAVGADVESDGNKSKEDDEDDGPAVVRPSINRSGSSRHKRKITKRNVSFGGDADTGNTEDRAAPITTGLGKRALEHSALRRGIASRKIPSRALDDAESDRPRYSKEYLDELQSSTPSTPRDISTLNIHDDGDEIVLDPSELDGALVMDDPKSLSSTQNTQILSEAEIREKKERRARLAKEQDFLSVEDDDDGVVFGRKEKDEGRLLAEDEDMGEGFDEYVEDGGLSLGKRADRERRKQERQQMADLINAAEGHSSDDSSESDAERRIAYETAQSKAGLDGLTKPQVDPSDEMFRAPSKITPLPQLSDCVARFQATLKRMEEDLNAKMLRVDQLKHEKDEIDKRKTEVQTLLDETGSKYQQALMQGSGGKGLHLGLAGERGLESLGTTPRQEPEEMDVDMS